MNLHFYFSFSSFLNEYKFLLFDDDDNDKKQRKKKQKNIYILFLIIDDLNQNEREKFIYLYYKYKFATCWTLPWVELWIAFFFSNVRLDLNSLWKWNA